MAWEWYAVKTLHRWEAFGEPQNPDKNYDPNATLLEERVVLIKARTFDEAIRKAEKGAAEYPGHVMINPYSQEIRFRYMETCDAYLLSDPPGEGTPSGLEVYSATEREDASIPDEELIARRFGKEPEGLGLRRTKFLDRDIHAGLEHELTKKEPM
jgi:hypothetical protein